MEQKWPHTGLPLEDVAGASSASSPAPTGTPSRGMACALSTTTWLASGLHILVAEDDPTLGEALAGFLQEKGHQVDWARTGDEALQRLKSGAYSLVITDLVMPGADGLAVLKASRQCEPPPLVVLMTGYASIDSAILAIREGAYDYLRKPFKLQEIEIAVANAARLLHLYQENQNLLRRLRDLTDQLEHQGRPLLADSQGGAATCAPQEPAHSPPPFRLAWAWSDRARPYQADLDRLHDLYQQNLLTEKEYQVLKQRLLI